MADTTEQHGRLREFRAPAQQETSRSVEVDASGETGIIRDVLVLGNNARGMGTYSRSVQEAAVSKFDNKPTFINHTKDGSNPGYERKLGVHRSPRISPEGIRTDFHFNAKHPVASQLIWDAKNDPSNLGFSMDADCYWNSTDKNGRRVVKNIEKIYGIDLVSKAGTVNGLFEEESELPADQQPLAESVLSAADNCRSIVLSDGTLSEKRGRLLEAIQDLRGELWEGDIADEMAANKPMRDMREAADIASRQLDEARWSSDKYPHAHDKIKRHKQVLNDHLRTISGIACNCPDCGGKTNVKEETSDMEFKELTIESLTKERPDLIEKLQGKDEHTRLTEEAKNAKQQLADSQAEIARLQGLEAGRIKEDEITTELKTAGIDAATASTMPATKGLFGRLREQLLSAPDKTARQAIIQDYKPAFSGRVQEAGMPGPMELLNDPAVKQQGTLSADTKKKYFG